MTYQIDVAEAQEISRGDWSRLPQETLAARDRTRGLADEAVETMQTASRNAKTRITEELTGISDRWANLQGRLEGANVTGPSMDNIRRANSDLTARVNDLQAALTEAFEELDREIVQLGGEVQRVVQEFGGQLDRYAERADSDRVAFDGFVENADHVMSAQVQYGG